MSTKVPPLFLRVAWNRDDKDCAYDFDYGNGNGMALPEKKLEVKFLHHKINLKQDYKNSLLISKTWPFLKQENGKWQW
ncbi:hypothetical protein [uncultured Fenollaria sp.]|uniref:hypothetical protein n=1 Tax=uncultured Fenollaria sp. TaxID=1686315 RepID=UPI0025DE853C|nr:hypothetical protein [uncultured Fenollaria sp.]